MENKNQITNNKIGISREIIRGDWNLTLREKRLLMLAISKVDYRPGTALNNDQKWNNVEIEDNQVVVTIDEYQQLVGKDRTQHDAARDLKVVTKSLSKKSLAIINDKHIRTINYTSANDYYADEKMVVITFNALFWPYLINLTRYVGYRLNECKNLSANAWRLYEVLLSYPPNKTNNISIDILKFSLGCEKKITSDFLKRNLRPAIDEINNYTTKKVAIETKRQGRTITAVYFRRIQ